MYKKGVLTFDYNSWSRGIAPSPYAGIADMRNVDPFSSPGALLCGRKAVEESNGTFDSLVRYMSYDAQNDILYGGSATGQLLSRTSGGTWDDVNDNGIALSQADECNGIAFWKDHIIYAETTKLHVFDIANPFWNEDWQTFAEGTRNLIDLPHFMHIGQDDVVYMCDGKYIASLQEQSGQTFDPTNSGTYTFNAQALDLPDGYVANSLDEYGQYLIIGTYYSEVLNRGNRADTFPWDRTSASFNIPIQATGNGVLLSKNHNNRLFTIIDRTNGRITSTNLSSYEVLKEIRNISDEMKVFPDAIDVKDNEILFGLGSDTATAENLGVYGYKDGFYHLKNVLSCGDTGVEIGSIKNIGDNKLIVTWEYNGTYGADLISDDRYSNYDSRIDSQYYQVGTPLNLKQFQNLDIHLGKNLSTGQGVKVYYRSSLADSFTEIAEFSYTTHGEVAAAGFTPQMSPSTHCQIRVEKTCANNSTDSPEFMRLELY